MEIEIDDILISREPHSCVVKFVEEVNEGGVLLVDGIQDEWYEIRELYIIDEKYEMLCKKEDRKDINTQTK